jgi:hypothetical protein
LEPELRDGAEWAEHEDLIVGNEEGLRRLRDACDIAIRDGECIRGDLGEWVGVRRMPDAWFDMPQESFPTRVTNKLIAASLAGAVIVFLVGCVSIVRWAFSW